MRTASLGLEPGIALAAEHLSKRRTNVHELRYAPAVTVAARVRDRLAGGTGRVPPGQLADGGAVDDDEDDEGDDDIDNEDEESAEDVPELIGLDWPLRNIDFTLPQGTALGVVGDRDSVDALVRILVRMTAPTEGRVVYRGRIGLSFEFSRALARRDLSQPRNALRSLASLAGLPRRERAAWVASALTLITGEPDPRITLANARPIGEGVPLAVSLDPTANVLVVDRFPGVADGPLFARSVERLRSRLAAGAAAVIATRDTTIMAEVCSTAMRLEQGEIADFGPASRILEDFDRHQAESKRRARASLPAFNEDLAIISATLESADGERPEIVSADDAPRLRVGFETAQPDTMVSWRLILSGPTSVTLAEKQPIPAAKPGPYSVTFTVPTAQLEVGDYEVVVEARVLADNGRSVLRRRARGRLRAETPPGLSGPEGDLEGLVAEWTLLEEA